MSGARQLAPSQKYSVALPSTAVRPCNRPSSLFGAADCRKTGSAAGAEGPCKKAHHGVLGLIPPRLGTRLVLPIGHRDAAAVGVTHRFIAQVARLCSDQLVHARCGFGITVVCSKAPLTREDHGDIRRLGSIGEHDEELSE